MCAQQNLLKECAQKVGQQCAHVVAGGAKSGNKLLAFLSECFETVGELSFLNSCGTSEGGGGIVNGQLTCGTEATLLNPPKMGFFTKGDLKQEEFCLSTKCDTTGYWGEPELMRTLFKNHKRQTNSANW